MSSSADPSSATVAAAAASSASTPAPSADVYKGKHRVYTKTGDKGTTSLFNMERRSKSDDSFSALGDTDELNAQLGVVRAHCVHGMNQGAAAGGTEHTAEVCKQLEDQLAEIQSRLFDVGAHLATPRSTSNPAQQARTEFDEHHVEVLESWIDGMEASLPPLRNFILPSGGFVATHLHVCRAVCRRAERSTVPLVQREDALPVIQRYLNRLSDYLFVAARYAARASEQPETIWKKPRTKREAAATPTSSPDE